MGRVFRRRKRRLAAGRLWRVLLLFLCLTGATLAVFIRCRPVMAAFAENRAVWLATQVSNEVVAEVMEQQAEVCRSMIRTTYNDKQILSAVFTDTAAINTVKTAVTQEVLRRLDGLSVIQVGVPLGTLAGLKWLSGWGPMIQFPVSVSAKVLSTVSSALEATGINQTSYRVLVHVDIGLYVVTPSGRSSVSAATSYPMAEAVLLGEVPDNLTEVYGDDQSLLGKIFDYGTAE